MRIVLDASAQVELLLQTEKGAQIEAMVGKRSMHAPELQTTETLSVLRKLSAAKIITAVRASIAVADLEGFPVELYEHGPLIKRVWALRGHVSAYDATYLALAERLGAALVTGDRRLARTTGHRVKVETPST